MPKMFIPKAAAVVFDIEKRSSDGRTTHLSTLRPVVIENLNRLDVDDVTCIYSPTGDLCAYATLGEAVAAVSDYHELEFDLPLAVKECLVLLHELDAEDRALFVFTNRFRNEQSSRLQRALEYGMILQVPCECNFYGVGDVYSKSLANVIRVNGLKTRFSHFSAPANAAGVVARDFARLIGGSNATTNG